MGQTVGDFVIERLGKWGVGAMFGYPGDGINGVFAALQKADCPIKFVQVRHEEMAAFMATAFAKFSGTLGVCISTGGPGATHLITGLYDAKLDHQPVLAITGDAARGVRGVRGAHYQQEINIDRAFAHAAIYDDAAVTIVVSRSKDRGFITPVTTPDIEDERVLADLAFDAVPQAFPQPLVSPALGGGHTLDRSGRGRCRPLAAARQRRCRDS